MGIIQLVPILYILTSAIIPGSTGIAFGCQFDPLITTDNEPSAFFVACLKSEPLVFFPVFLDSNLEYQMSINIQKIHYNTNIKFNWLYFNYYRLQLKPFPYLVREFKQDPEGTNFVFIAFAGAGYTLQIENTISNGLTGLIGIEFIMDKFSAIFLDLNWHHFFDLELDYRQALSVKLGFKFMWGYLMAGVPITIRKKQEKPKYPIFPLQ